MTVSTFTVMLLAAFVWYSGGIALVLKGMSLARSAYAIDPDSFWSFGAPLLGIAIGLVKARFIFNHACKKNILRIGKLEAPKLWQCFRPGMLIFLAIIIPTGAMDVEGCCRQVSLSLPCVRTGFFNCHGPARFEHIVLENESVFERPPGVWRSLTPSNRPETGNAMIHIDREKCVGCGGCVDLCPAAAIRFVKDRARIGNQLCLECTTCVRVCPMKAPAEV